MRFPVRREISAAPAVAHRSNSASAVAAAFREIPREATNEYSVPIVASAAVSKTGGQASNGRPSAATVKGNDWTNGATGKETEKIYAATGKKNGRIGQSYARKAARTV
jgi:hypothetical protein